MNTPNFLVWVSSRLSEVNLNVSINLSSLCNLFHKQTTRLRNECFKNSCLMVLTWKLSLWKFLKCLEN